MSQVRDLFRQVEDEQNQLFFERREVIRGLLVGLLAREHVLLLGPPGTAKSALANDLCSRIGGKYFYWLLSRTSTPEELFGPVSLKALEQDSYRRVTTGKLPEADIAFKDEIFKCNSAVLNTMLPVLNERVFFNDGQPVAVPLEMAVGASNELPEDREELGALWDRFLLRYVVSYIKDPRNFVKLLGNSPAGPAGGRTLISRDDLAGAQAEARQVDVSRIIPQITALRQKMAELKIPVSDRRWKQGLGLIRANAWLEGRSEAGDDDLAILAAVLWTDPEQALQVRQAIMALANPLEQEAQNIFDEAMEVWQTALQAPEETATAAGIESNAKLKKIAKRLEELRNLAQAQGKNDYRITETLANVVRWNEEVNKKCLGISV